MRITLSDENGSVASEQFAEIYVDGQTFNIVRGDHHRISYRGDQIAIVKQGYYKKPNELLPFVYKVEIYGTRMLLDTIYTNDPVSSDEIYRCARVAQRSR